MAIEANTLEGVAMSKLGQLKKQWDYENSVPNALRHIQPVHCVVARKLFIARFRELLADRVTKSVVEIDWSAA